MILALFLTALFALWAIYLYRVLEKTYRVHLKYFFEPDVNLMAKYEVGARYDAIHIKEHFWKNYIAGIFMIPLRIISFCSIFICLNAWSWAIMKIFGVTYENCNNIYSKAYQYLQLIPAHISSYGLMLTLGFGVVEKKKYSIYDFIPDYKAQQNTSIGPIVVSNHCSFFDVFYYWREYTSFLSKAATMDTPLMNSLPLSKQCVFLETHHKKGRSDSQKRLMDRLEKNLKGQLPPITVFPEGTLNNAETIMKFKKGAFDHTYPIRIRTTQFFKEDYFSASFANMNAYTFMIVVLCMPEMFLKIHEIEENIDPLFILKKNGVKPEDPEAWKIVADEVKEIMSFMTGCRTTEQGYKDLVEYEKQDCWTKDTMGGTFMRRTGCGSKRMDKYQKYSDRRPETLSK